MRAALTGLAWDDPRGIGAIQACSREFAAATGIAVDWQPRSLRSFGLEPLHRLASRYDLLLIDYPHVGPDLAGVLHPLDTLVPQSHLTELAANSVGPSYESYTFAGHVWALPIDAAAEVAVYRPDLMAGLAVPFSYDDVLDLPSKLPKGCSLAMPLVPIDACCHLVTIANAVDDDGYWTREGGPNATAIRSAIDLLVSLAKVCHSASFKSDPPTLLDVMSTSHTIAYCPLTFGYSNYARSGFRPNTLRFGDAPQGPGGKRGSILGGVGIGVSALSERKEAAAEFAMYVSSRVCQQGVYFRAGGQPGHLAAWLSPDVNAAAGDFFYGTMQTLNSAYRRPRIGEDPFFVLSQDKVGSALSRALTDGEPADRVYRQVMAAFREVADSGASAFGDCWSVDLPS